MGLKEAITAVLPWAGKDRLSGVLITPSTADAPGYVEAQNEDGFGARRYYADAPQRSQLHVWLGAASLKEAIRSVKAGMDWSVQPRSEDSFTLALPDGGTFFLQAPPFPHDHYAQPVFPEHLTPFERPEHIVALLATCPKPTKEYEAMPALSGVLFGEGYVTTTNQNALTHIRRPGLASERVLVPRGLFAKWPKKKLKTLPCIGFTGTHAFAFADGLLTWAPLKPNVDFPDRASHLPESHQGHKTVLSRTHFLNVVKGSISAGKPVVNIRLAENQLSVTAVDADTEEVAYRSHPIACVTQHPGMVSFFCNGKILYEMLNACPTEAVKLQYSDLKTDAIHLESSDGYVRCVLMPMVVPPPSESFSA